MPGWAIAVIAFVAVVEGLWLASILHHRRSTSPRPAPGARTPAVTWQAGRWDGDRRHAYVANLGDDVAYEVIVTDHDRVMAVADSVPPYTADQLTPGAD